MCTRRVCLARALHRCLVPLALVLTVALASTLLPSPVAWAVLTGDQFTSAWTETSPTAGLSGTADITLGAPDGPVSFNLASFAVTIGTDICFSCGLLTEDLSGAKFDTTTLLLSGNIT